MVYTDGWWKWQVNLYEKRVSKWTRYIIVHDLGQYNIKIAALQETTGYGLALIFIRLQMWFYSLLEEMYPFLCVSLVLLN